jgi:hypothetical protein
VVTRVLRYSIGQIQPENSWRDNSRKSPSFCQSGSVNATEKEKYPTCFVTPAVIHFATQLYFFCFCTIFFFFPLASAPQPDLFFYCTQLYVDVVSSQFTSTLLLHDAFVRGRASAILSCKKWLLRRSSLLYLSPFVQKKRLPIIESISYLLVGLVLFRSPSRLSGYLFGSICLKLLGLVPVRGYNRIEGVIEGATEGAIEGGGGIFEG